MAGAALCAAWAVALAWAPRGLAVERAPWPVGTRVAAVLFAAVSLAALALRPGGAAVRTESALLVETALALAVFDARHLLIPDLYVVALALAGFVGPLAPGWAAALGGAVVGGGLVAAVRAGAGRALGREAMGWGDVKLAAALGALLGPLPLLWTLTTAAGLGAAAGLVRRRRRDAGAVEEAALTAFGAWLAPVGVLAALLISLQ